MLREGGIEGVSIRKLCARVDVSPRTIYNAFESKERLVALAIREAYESANRNVRFRTSADSLGGVIDRLIFNYRNSMKTPHFARSISTLYFAAGLSPDIWAALQSMMLRFLAPWLDKVAADDGLQPCVEVGRLAESIVTSAYATSHDWSEGRVADQEFLRRLVEGMLRLASASMKGPERTKVETMLSQICETGALPDFPNPGWRDERVPD